MNGPTNWRRTALGSICKVSYGKALPAQARAALGSFDVYGSAGIVGRHDRALVDRPCVIVGRKGNVGRCFFSLRPCWPIDTTYFLSPGPEIDGRFLSLQITHSKLEKLDSSTTVPSLRRSDLESLSLFLPPIRDQEEWVEFVEEQFLRLDAAERSLSTVASKLATLRNQAFVMAFHGRIRETLPLGEIADVVGGVAKDSKTQARPGLVELPYLRVANVQRGYLDLSSVATIRVDARTADKLLLRTGDVLFNEGGDRDKLGRGWIWENQIERCIHQNHVFRARLNPASHDPKFVSFYGNTVGRQWFETHGKQTTNLASVSLGMLKAFPIPRLPLSEQREIVQHVQAQLSMLESALNAVERAVRHSRRLRSAVLAAAFQTPTTANEEAGEGKCMKPGLCRLPSNSSRTLPEPMLK